MEIIQEKKAYKLGSGWTGSEVKWADLNMPAVRVFRIKSIQLDECKIPLRQQTELGWLNHLNWKLLMRTGKDIYSKDYQFLQSLLQYKELLSHSVYSPSTNRRDYRLHFDLLAQVVTTDVFGLSLFNNSRKWNRNDHPPIFFNWCIVLFRVTGVTWVSLSSHWQEEGIHPRLFQSKAHTIFRCSK